LKGVGHGPADRTDQGWVDVITVKRLNGLAFLLNPDLIERADGTPDTVVTLVDGTKYVIAESLDELADRVRRYRAWIIVTADDLAEHTATPSLQPAALASAQPSTEPSAQPSAPPSTPPTTGTATLLHLLRPEE
jgi:flagellar protein FlbD